MNTFETDTWRVPRNPRPFESKASLAKTGEMLLGTGGIYYVFSLKSQALK